MALLVLAFAAFVALGLPDGALGVAWPSMRDTFDQPVGSLGILIAAITVGYLTSTAANGFLASRLGTGRHLLLATAASTAGLATFVVADQWPVLVAGTALVGAGGGGIDAEVNAHVAVHHGVRAMGFLHACFGIGATIAPAIMTAFLAAGASWRNGYVVLLVVEAALIVAFVVTRQRWGGRLPVEERTVPARPNAILIATLALFFVYTGLEISAGQWAFTLLTEERGLGTTVAGLAVSAYWGSLTAGRLLLAFLGNRATPASLLRWSTVGAAVATALLWWSPVPAVGPIALVVLGFCLAAVFPTLVSLTPVRLGERRASAVIGYQLAAGGLGGGAFPALAGAVAGGISLAALPPFLFAIALVMVALNATASRLA